MAGYRNLSDLLAWCNVLPGEQLVLIVRDGCYAITWREVGGCQRTPLSVYHHHWARPTW